LVVRGPSFLPFSLTNVPHLGNGRLVLFVMLSEAKHL